MAEYVSVSEDARALRLVNLLFEQAAAEYPPGSGVVDADKPWKKYASEWWETLGEYNSGNMCAPPG